MSPNKPVTALDLQKLDLAQLEELYESPRPATRPTGLFRGTHLDGLSTPGALAPWNRLYAWLLFQKLPFGIDFRSNTWYLGHKRLRVGRFSPHVGASRWRMADVVSLHYQDSHLPHVVRDMLYDEVKPLSDTLCLGLGGVNAERGQGDHFFFALEKTSA